jgi:hypothetical protein
MGIAFMQINNEEGWKTKSLEIGIPYFEKTISGVSLPLPVLRPKAHSKV